MEPNLDGMDPDLDGKPIWIELLDSIDELRTSGPLLDIILQKLDFYQQAVSSKALEVSQVWKIVEGNFYNPERPPAVSINDWILSCGSEQNDEIYFHDCCDTMRSKLKEIKSGKVLLDKLQRESVLTDVGKVYIAGHQSHLNPEQPDSWLFFNHFTPSGASLHSLLNDNQASLFIPVLTPQLFASKLPTSAFWFLFRMLLGLSEPLDSSRFSILSPVYRSIGISTSVVVAPTAETSNGEPLLLGVLLLASDLVPLDEPNPSNNTDGLHLPRPILQTAGQGDDGDETFGEMLTPGAQLKLDKLAELLQGANLPYKDPELD